VRQVALDTETTGLSTKNGDRVIEIGCVEIIDRTITGREFHTYINPERKVSQETILITGIKDEFLINKPKFSVVAEDFLKFIYGAELIIHNAAFDVEFINNELKLINHSIQDISYEFKILDTLALARSIHPGQRNNLDSLCKRYKINYDRALHGALIDAKILAKLSLKMTAGQINLNFDCTVEESIITNFISTENKVLKIMYANAEEVNLHNQYLNDLLNRKTE
jgi:DNA polymerase III subunit epsilon